MRHRNRDRVASWPTVLLLTAFGLAGAAILTTAMSNMGQTLQFLP